MPLNAGTRLGPYVVEGLIGTGGMGEVYRARDTRLDRSVALKVLPQALIADPTLRQRLEREARAISSLDHPHICALYDIGSDAGSDYYIVMQLLQGQTLADRLTSGPLPLADVLTISAQIADALAAAHRRGFVHRDLKPGNVMLTRGRDGEPFVKLLDFGLAKQIGGPVMTSDAATGTIPLTAERTVVGTLHYMAPEQLEDRDTDARTDIFALGLVLYEMATGRRAFDGPSSAGVVAAILIAQPAPIADRVPLAPASLDVVVRRCLQKNADDRWQSAADLAWELRRIANTTEAATRTRRPRFAVPVASAAMGMVILGAIAIYGIPTRTTSEAAPEVRLSLLPPHGYSLDSATAEYDAQFAVSPDGRQIAYVVVDPERRRQLWVRALDDVQGRLIPGADRANRPFWSPDGRYIAYASREGLVKVPVTGGGPQPITHLSGNAFFANGSWGGGLIMFDRAMFAGPPSTADFAERVGGLLVVPEDGGPPAPVPHGNAPANSGQRYPVILPDGRHFLFLSWASNPADRAVYLGSLDSDVRTRLVASGFKAFYANGYLCYIRDRRLVAQRLSIESATLTGEPIVLVDEIALEAIPGQATVSVSQSGAIAYRSRNTDFESEPRWITRTGQIGAMVSAPATDITMSLAPDGRRALVTRLIATATGDERMPSNIWVLDLVRGVATRATLDATVTDENPVWSPDGSQFAYASHRGGALSDLRVQRTTDPGSARVLASGVDNFHPVDWSRDGEYLLLQRYSTAVGADDIDLWVLPMRDGGKPVKYIEEPYVQAQGQFSPDGRWVAYMSDESGRSEVYVRPFPAGPGRAQVSSSGGGQPRWRGDGRELYYVDLTGNVLAVPLDLRDGDIVAGATVRLFSEPPLRLNNSPFLYGGMANYDVSRDGSRMLVNHLVREPGLGPLQLVLNAIRSH